MGGKSMSHGRLVLSAILFWALFWTIGAPQPCALAQQPKSLADRAYKDGVLEKVAGLVESKYVLADKAKGFADEFRAKREAGAYESYLKPKEFAEKVTADLIEITRDKHFNFRVIVPSDAGEKPQSPLHHPVRYYLLRNKENTGFYRLEWIEPSIGYVDIHRFNHFGEAKDMMLAAMRFLSGANAVIIDIRENGGGSGDYLSSYFLPYPTQLSGSYSREDGSLTEFWTRKDIGMEPRTDVPLFILTSPRTFSAAESFAYDMQSRKRATIVGEPTKGGAHSVDLFSIDDQFEFYISTERAISPVTGANWEGTGVLPDVSVPSAMALDRAVGLAKKAGEAFGQAKEARLKKAVDEMQVYLDRALKLYRAKQPDSAGAALDSLFRIAEAAGLISEFFIDVFAYNYRSGEDEQIFLAILKKEVEFFPNSSSAQERLASAYHAMGNKELALRYYKKALELAPENRNVGKMIKELQGK
jgi:Peptidase family S41/N-terminal domain of Peptidase_S41 in eukaryotic IRBP/Tetratricopeptide repeat